MTRLQSVIIQGIFSCKSLKIVSLVWWFDLKLLKIVLYFQNYEFPLTFQSSRPLYHEWVLQLLLLSFHWGIKCISLRSLAVRCQSLDHTWLHQGEVGRRVDCYSPRPLTFLHPLAAHPQLSYDKVPRWNPEIAWLSLLIEFFNILIPRAVS